MHLLLCVRVTFCGTYPVYLFMYLPVSVCVCIDVCTCCILCVFVTGCVYQKLCVMFECVHVATCTCYLICVPDAVFTFF